MNVAPPPDTPRVFRFGDCEVDAARFELWRGDSRCAIQPKPFDLLVLLLERAGGVVTHQELRNRVWPGVFVKDDSITFCVRTVRRILGDSSVPPTLIQTVRGRGYTFTARVVTKRAVSGLPRHAKFGCPMCGSVVEHPS